MSESRMGSAKGMKCPVCDVDLVMSERQGIEIDYCPRCRGVWLDRGELDKVIERSAGSEAPRSERTAPSRDYDDDRKRGYGYEDRSKYGHGGYRRKSWLSEIFD